MFVEPTLKQDPDNAGWVLGWAVLCPKPWHLFGMYGSKDEADINATQQGDKYVVKYGSHCIGTDNFISVEIS